METTLTKPSNGKFEIAKELNGNVLAVLTSDQLIGFEKAYLIADAIGKLKILLTTEYMKPIMELQGSRLGFKTDKDKEGGYKEQQVKECIIDAVLSGVQPFGNQFNIIAGNMYITKEGFGYLLNKIAGLSYEITFALPRISSDAKSAAIIAKISWTMNGEKKDREMDFPIKMNSFMGSDAVIGKATRKARAWLFNTISGTEFGDGDITDSEAKVISSNIPVNKEEERITLMIKDALTLDELDKLRPSLLTEAHADQFADKREQLLKGNTNGSSAEHRGAK